MGGGANITQPYAAITKRHNDDHVYCACQLQRMLMLVVALHNPDIPHDGLRVPTAVSNIVCYVSTFTVHVMINAVQHVLLCYKDCLRSKSM